MEIYQCTPVFHKHGEVANCFVYIRCFTLIRTGSSFYIFDIDFGVEFWEYFEDRSIGEGVGAEI
jgi:hypothetical protein